MIRNQKKITKSVKRPHLRKSHIRVLTNPKRLVNVKSTIVHKEEYFKLYTKKHRNIYNERTGSNVLSNILIEYVGSKASFEDTVQYLIRENIDTNKVDTVVIPFQGGGSDFLNVAPMFLDKNITFVLNDLNPTITNLITEIRDNKEALIKEVKKIRAVRDNKLNNPTIDDYKKEHRFLIDELNSLEKQGKLDVRRAALFITLMNATFGGNYEYKHGVSKVSIAGDMKKYERFNIVDKINMYAFYMEKFKIVIHTDDFSNVMNMYDQKRTLFLIDAPYLQQDSKYLVSTAVTYGNPDFPHEKCIDMTKKLKGQFIYHNYRNKVQESMFENCKNIDMIEYKKPTNNAKSVNGKKKMSVEVMYYSTRQGV